MIFPNRQLGPRCNSPLSPSRSRRSVGFSEGRHTPPEIAGPTTVSLGRTCYNVADFGADRSGLSTRRQSFKVHRYRLTTERRRRLCPRRHIRKFGRLDAAYWRDRDDAGPLDCTYYFTNWRSAILATKLTLAGTATTILPNGEPAGSFLPFGAALQMQVMSSSSVTHVGFGQP
jgi:hypothetical protein